MYNKTFISLLLFSALLCGCGSITEFADPDNSYTAETTYTKLIKQYPFISIASRDLPAGVKERKNLTYVRYGRRALQLDLYQPVNPQQKLTPLVVLVHGGGWMHGYRQNLSPLAIRLAERGYAAAVISYRLSPEALYPAAIFDAKAAVRWLRRNAKQYAIDEHHIAIAGGSAGGQIASLTAMTSGLPKFDPQAASSRISSDIQAIINIDGLSDFTSPEALKYENNLHKVSSAGRWFGGSYEEKPALWKEASPINYVGKNMPPILFIDSAQVRFSLGRDEMIEKMKPLGVPYKVVLLPDTPHSFWLFDPWLAPTVTAAVDFLNDQFHYSWP